MNQLKGTLAQRRMVPIRDASGDVQLTSVRNLINTEYIAVEDYVKALEADEKMIMPDTLEIIALDDIPDAPATPPAEDTPPPAATSEDKASAEDTPPPEPPATWTEEDLKKLSYRDLQKLAKLYDDVHGNQGTDHMVETLIGKPRTSIPT